MDNNSIYNFETLIGEDSFRSWVIDNDTESALFWEKTTVQYPESKKIILLAKSFLLALHEPNTLLQQQDLDLITAKILAR